METYFFFRFSIIEIYISNEVWRAHESIKIQPTKLFITFYLWLKHVLLWNENVVVDATNKNDNCL